MTLSPVFRSVEAVRLLEQHRIWEELAPALALQGEAVERVHADFEQLIGPAFRLDREQWLASRDAAPGSDGQTPPELALLQDYFFLTLFLSLFESLGINSSRLPFYAE